MLKNNKKIENKISISKTIIIKNEFDSKRFNYQKRYVKWSNLFVFAGNGVLKGLKFFNELLEMKTLMMFIFGGLSKLGYGRMMRNVTRGTAASSGAYETAKIVNQTTNVDMKSIGEVLGNLSGFFPNPVPKATVASVEVSSENSVDSSVDLVSEIIKEVVNDEVKPLSGLVTLGSMGLGTDIALGMTGISLITSGMKLMDQIGPSDEVLLKLSEESDKLSRAAGQALVDEAEKNGKGVLWLAPRLVYTVFSVSLGSFVKGIYNEMSTSELVIFILGTGLMIGGAVMTYKGIKRIYRKFYE